MCWRRAVRLLGAFEQNMMTVLDSCDPPGHLPLLSLLWLVSVHRERRNNEWVSLIFFIISLSLTPAMLPLGIGVRKGLWTRPTALDGLGVSSVLFSKVEMMHQRNHSRPRRLLFLLVFSEPRISKYCSNWPHLFSFPQDSPSLKVKYSHCWRAYILTDAGKHLKTRSRISFQRTAEGFD